MKLTAEELINKHLELVGGKYQGIKDGNVYEACINALNEAINYSQCCTQLKEKEALTFDEFQDEFYYKAQMGIYESKATGMFYNLTDLEKRYKKYCERF